MAGHGYGVPEIFEEEAAGNVKRIYNDIKQVLKVPIVNFFFRTTALYETFFNLGWSQVRPNMLTINMENAAETLRYPSISLHPPQINWSQYFDMKTINEIRGTIFTFNYVNPKLLLIASAWAESLSNRSISGGVPVSGYITQGIIPNLPNIKLVHIPEAAPLLQSLLLDIAKVHHTFDIASDFRALAHYPEFLSVSWSHLRHYVGSDEYNKLSAQLKNRSIELARQMPFPVIVNRETLSQYYTDADIAGIMGVVSMFQNFLPGLIIDGEFFRRII